MATSTDTRVRRRALAAPALVLLAFVLAWPAAANAAPTLQFGSEGPRVAALQRAFGVEVDGVFGDDLRVAVVALQRAHGLPADGAVGPATWGLLENIRARALQRRRRTAPRGADGALPPAAAPQRPALAGARRRTVRARRPSRGSRARSLASHGAEARAPRTRPRSRRAPAQSSPPSARPRTRRLPAPPSPPRSGTLGGWGRALESSLRLSAYRAAERRALRVVRRMSRAMGVAGRRAPAAALGGPTLRIGVRPRPAARGRDARPQIPRVVRRVIAAGDRIATLPYRYGGGHGNFDDSAYDCSGSISYALHGGGLLDVSLASGGFMSWGEPGPGRWITIYTSPGHAFMVVAGRRFDTSGRGQTGSRWQADTRGAGAGYVVRHPAGL